MTDALCVKHVEQLTEISESLTRGEARMASIEKSITQNQSAIIRMLEDQSKRLDLIESRQTVIEENQNTEVRYWRIGRRVAMWAGLPAIIAWLAVLAKILKVQQ